MEKQAHTRILVGDSYNWRSRKEMEKAGFIFLKLERRTNMVDKGRIADGSNIQFGRADTGKLLIKIGQKEAA